MRESLLFTLRAMVRGRVLPLLLAAVALIHWLMPGFVRSDGTSSGALEMYIRSVPGCVAVVVQLTILAVACGLFAKEREEKRLALTLTRPVPAFSVAVGKWLALAAVSAAALMASSLLLFLFPHGPGGDKAFPPCRHHYAPSLPPPDVCAGQMLESYLNDPETPEAVKKASKGAVLTLLTTKEQDRYDVVKPGESFKWPYDVKALREKMSEGAPLSLRVRFSTLFDMRTPVAGELHLGGYAAVVSNNTQALLDIPFAHAGCAMTNEAPSLVFSNTGESTVMIRPRRDLEVLSPGDSFWWNLFRSQLETLSLSMLLAAFGIFMSASLSRPVAIFTALCSFALVLMAPSVIVQFPDEFHAPLADRIGLAISRLIQTATSSVSVPSPVSDLAEGRAIEWPDLMRTFVGNAVVLPAVLLAAAAFVARRKPLSSNI